MSKLVERLLLFVITIPILIGSCYFLPQYNFLALHILMVVAVAVGAIEVRRLLSNKFEVYQSYFSTIVSVVPLLVLYLYHIQIVSRLIVILSIIAFILFIFVKEIFVAEKKGFTKSVERVTSELFVFIYPTVLVMFLSLITSLANPQTTILMFFTTVFSCDSVAWFFGVLFGKNNRGVVKSSPNKSIAGFIGGAVGSILFAIPAYLFFEPFSTSLPKTLVLMALTGCMGILGDLFESILKRSVNIKDSGKIVLGRGGVMDSIDSVIFAAPVFYFVFKFLF